MAENRIGLREVRALKPGQVVWDGAVAGFGARRQQSAVASYVLIYRTLEGRQRWHTSADTVHLGPLRLLEPRPNDCSGTSRRARIPRP